MKVFSHPKEFTGSGESARSRGVCLAIGVFDGVHLGHQQVIRQTMSDAIHHEAAAVILTFDRHPNTVVAPDKVPPLIYPLEQKLEVLAKFNAAGIFLIHFDEAFSRLTGEEFVRRLILDFGKVHSICVGSAFTFGHKRGGNVALLNRLGSELGFNAHGLGAVALDGKTVSSTRIREAIRAGTVDAASQMLGRTYSIRSIVQQGDRLGKTLGFPTANLDVSGLVLPPNGVYAVHVHLAGKAYRGALNLGFRPTLNQPEPRLRCEVHILGFDQAIYGETIEVFFEQKLRDEKKFAHIDDLKSQIARDVRAAAGAFD